MPGCEEIENEIRCRLRDPEDFTQSVMETDFKRVPVEEAEGVSLLLGTLRPFKVPDGQDYDSLVPQAVCFDKAKWTSEQAQQWLAEHPDLGGSLEAARVSLSLTEAEPPTRIRIFPKGESHFQWNSGKQASLLVDEAGMGRAIGAFNARGHDMVIDYEHMSEGGAMAPAAGWVKKLEAAVDGLWAAVEWTRRAAEYIKNKEYRFISPVIYHDPAGRLLFLSSIALTNMPATIEAEPLVASYGADGGPGEKFTAAELKAREDTLTARLEARHTRESFIATLTQEGRFPPYWRELGVAAFLEKLEGTEGRVQLSDKGEVNLADWFKEFLAKLPRHIFPGRLVYKGKVPSGSVADQLDQLTVARMRERPYMNYSEAFAAVQREHPSLAQLYLSERDQK